MIAGSIYPQDEAVLAAAIALAVKAELQLDLNKLTEIWQLEGLDITKPLVVTDISRDVDTVIHQTVNTNNNSTTVTRT